jgi:hypothetical protein
MKRKITFFALAGYIAGFSANGFAKVKPGLASALLKNPSLASNPLNARAGNPPPTVWRNSLLLTFPQKSRFLLISNKFSLPTTLYHLPTIPNPDT